ncbi:hypothetical protein GMB86_10700 [Terrilactibacillus sp. BCM23-1]|uniref:YrzI family small protein n=1 Tax=Terrilactibacillus tamarindi TaxID=2599694 RepID=A0A6N8CQP0_9BACI|nr:hypothetical protein [Terrilactibacillus tamarindi]MTT32474.1 hypothetical protein [Terrilactibacillus tamarindi]
MFKLHLFIVTLTVSIKHRNAAERYEDDKRMKELKEEVIQKQLKNGFHNFY